MFVRYLYKAIRNLVDTFPANICGTLFYRKLEKHKTSVLEKSSINYDSIGSLSPNVNQE